MIKSNKFIKKATSGSAGFDLEATNEIEILPHNKGVVLTDLKLEIPKGYYGQIKCRSGLAFNKNVRVFEGVIDSDYRGEVKILVYNEGTEVFKINKNDRIAQIIFIPYIDEIEFSNNLEETKRGEGGFGSSGN